MSKYDVVVVGAGPAGYPCAIRLGQLKKKVLVVESKLLGGLCTNWGCIPTKALSFAAEFVDSVQKAKRMGFDATLAGCDLDKLRSWKESVVSRLRTGIDYLFRANNVVWKQGSAHITAPHTVMVKHEGAEETFEAENIVITTGTEVVALPGLEFDHKYIIDTDDALEVRTVPPRLLVVGAGASGLEMATIYSRLGSSVCVVEIMEQILPGMDTELCESLQKIMRKSGIELHLRSRVTSCTVDGGKATVSIETPEGSRNETFDTVLVSVGRRPCTGAFGTIGIELDEKGYIKTDECLRTNVKNIYAAGDVAGPPLLAHKATSQGVAIAEIIAGEKDSYGRPLIPSCVFTIPPLSAAGMTEKEAAATGRKIVVGRFPYRASGKAVSMFETEGLVKVIGDDRGALLGVHVLGYESPNLIGEAALALQNGLSVGDIAKTVHPHPTLTEMMQEAAENFFGKAINVANK